MAITITWEVQVILLKSKQAGITLTEVMVIAMICVILTGSLVGFYQLGIKQAKFTDATAQGRQLYIALALYQDEHAAPRHFPSVDTLAASGYLNAPESALAKGDPFIKGQAGEALECRGLRTVKHPISWFQLQTGINPPSYEEELLNTLNSLDENHGVFTLLVYGEKNPLVKAQICEEIPYTYIGTSLMIRKDGSARQLDMRPDVRLENNGSTTSLCTEKLFTGISGTCLK